jgi:CheY-like chemotaxis protein
MKLTDAKILVVDDDKVMRKFVVNLMTRLGVGDVKDAIDGQEGLAVAASFRPDLVLSDVHMEPMDGPEFVRRLRTHAVGELRNVPVLMMSGDTSNQTLRESVPLGLAGYIIKPPQISSLKLKIEQALKYR